MWLVQVERGEILAAIAETSAARDDALRRLSAAESAGESAAEAEAGFGGRVKAARQKMRMTQQQLAESVGLDASAISRLEQGLRAIRLGEAVLIAEAIKTDIRSLIYGPQAENKILMAKVARLLGEMNRFATDAGSSITVYLTAMTELHKLLTNDKVRAEMAAVGYPDDKYEMLLKRTNPDAPEPRLLTRVASFWKQGFEGDDSGDATPVDVHEIVTDQPVDNIEVGDRIVEAVDDASDT